MKYFLVVALFATTAVSCTCKTETVNQEPPQEVVTDTVEVDTVQVSE